MDEGWAQHIGVCSCVLLRVPLVHVPACPCWGHSPVGLHRPSWWAVVTCFSLYCSSPLACAEFSLLDAEDMHSALSLLAPVSSLPHGSTTQQYQAEKSSGRT